MAIEVTEDLIRAVTTKDKALSDGRTLVKKGIPLLFELARFVRLKSESAGSVDATAGSAVDIEQIAAAIRLASAPACLNLADLVEQGDAPAPEEGHRQAEVLWEELVKAAPREQRLLLAASWDFRGWELVRVGCLASERTAAASPGEAIALAELALRVAQQTPGGAERAYLEGYAYAVLSNARRVAGQLPSADEALSRSRQLRAQGAAAAPPHDEALLLDLEASLRRDQRRFAEAVALHRQALAFARPDAYASILLNESKVHEELHDYGAALAVLQRARDFTGHEKEPRIAFGIAFNIAGNLCHLDRYDEAEQLLPEVRALALPLEAPLYLVRLRWLEAWVAGGLGRKAEACSALEEVRQAFLDHEIEYDRALVSLELTVYYLESGESARARDLAREALEIFERQKVPREALAALTVFHQATEQERASAGLARRLLRYLERARSEPELRFEV